MAKDNTLVIILVLCVCSITAALLRDVLNKRAQLLENGNDEEFDLNILDGGKQDCKGKWTEWSECSKSCGGGTQKRLFLTSMLPFGGGRECPQSPETRACNEKECDRDCEGEWSGWTECTKKCKEKYGQYGVQTRTYTVSQENSGNGRACPKKQIEERYCNMKDCPEGCDLKGVWEENWSGCDQDCWDGIKDGGRYGNQTKKFLYSGDIGQCPVKETRLCNKHRCTNDCMGEWRVLPGAPSSGAGNLIHNGRLMCGVPGQPDYFCGAKKWHQTAKAVTDSNGVGKCVTSGWDMGGDKEAGDLAESDWGEGGASLDMSEDETSISIGEGVIGSYREDIEVKPGHQKYHIRSSESDALNKNYDPMCTFHTDLNGRVAIFHSEYPGGDC